MSSSLTGRRWLSWLHADIRGNKHASCARYIIDWARHVEEERRETSKGVCSGVCLWYMHNEEWSTYMNDGGSNGSLV